MASKNRTDKQGSLYQRHLPTCPPPDSETRKRPEHECAGPWIGSYVVGWRDDKPIRRKVSGRSKTAANRKLQDLIDQHRSGNLPTGKVPTVEQWLNVWLEQIAPSRVRPTTMQTYRNRVRNRLIPALGYHRLDRLHPDHIEKAWRELIHERGFSSGSVLVDHRILSRALTVAEQRGYIKSNPARLIDAPKAENAEPDVLTLAEAKKVLAVVENLKRNSARWGVALSLGLRPGEALGLRWDDVNLDEGTILVRHTLSRLPKRGLVLGPAKSKSGHRLLVMPDPLARQMKAHRLAQNAERLAAGSQWHSTEAGGYVFAHPDGRPIDPYADRKAWHELTKTAKVRGVRPYATRHTAATLLLAQGVAPRVAMEIMGHSDLKMTTHYQHVADELQREAMKRQGDALWGS